MPISCHRQKYINGQVHCHLHKRLSLSLDRGALGIGSGSRGARMDVVARIAFIGVCWRLGVRHKVACMQNVQHLLMLLLQQLTRPAAARMHVSRGVPGRRLTRDWLWCAVMAWGRCTQRSSGESASAWWHGRWSLGFGGNRRRTRLKHGFCVECSTHMRP
jgi:hypothetical protein